MIMGNSYRYQLSHYVTHDEENAVAKLETY